MILGPNDIINSINGLQKQGSDLKIAIYSSILKGDSAPQLLKEKYLSKVSTFISSWSNYASELQEKIKLSSGREGINIIPYSFIKDYIYASYDYASILPFTDGIFKGVKKNEFTKPEDIDSFRKYTCAKAFKNRANTVGGLVDEVTSLSNYSNSLSSSISDAKMFDSIRGQKLFIETETRDIYKAIEKSVEFLFYSVKDGTINFPTDQVMTIAVLNNIIEYGTYTLAAWATRIYAISSYVEPFISSTSRYNEAVMTYGTQTRIYQIMNETDEGLARDFRRHGDFIEILEQFLVDLGVADELKDRNISNDSSSIEFSWRNYMDETSDNIFSSKLNSNPIIISIGNNMRPNGWKYTDKYVDRLKNAAEELKELMYVGRDTLPSIKYRPKNDILVTIAHTEPEKKTIESYKKFTKELVQYFGGFLAQIKSVMHDYEDNEFSPKSYIYTSSGENKARETIFAMLVELYTDIAVALLYRCRDLENNINHIAMAHAEDRDALTTLKNPFDSKYRPSLKASMYSVVPDTMRSSFDTIELYSSPTNDALNMYDEYAKKMLPDDQYYFNEAEEGLRAKIWNGIISFFTGIGTAISRFIEDVNFNRASKWVESHKDQLLTMDYVPPMVVKPFKSNIKVNELSSMINKVKNVINNKDVFKDKEAARKFMSSLFESQNFGRQLVAEGADINKCGEVYKYGILYGTTVSGTVTSITEPKPIELRTNEQIKKYMGDWVNTVLNAKDYFIKLREKEEEYKELINDLKEKTDEWTSEDIEESGITKDYGIHFFEDDQAASPDPQSSSQQSSDDSNPPAMNDSDKKDDNENSAEEAKKKELAELRDQLDFSIKLMTTVFETVWRAIYSGSLIAVREQYKYIQTAWESAKKKEKKK